LQESHELLKVCAHKSSILPVSQLTTYP